MSVDRVEFPRVDFDHRGSAGWYLWEGHVRLVCGGCGRDIGHLLNHTIETDGTVHASILCPDSRCRWHVWGRLLDWTGGRKMPGKGVE